MTKPPKPMTDKAEIKKIKKKLTKELRAKLDKDYDCINEFCNRHTPGGCYHTMQLAYVKNKPVHILCTPRKLVKDCNCLIKPTKTKQDAR